MLRARSISELTSLEFPSESSERHGSLNRHRDHVTAKNETDKTVLPSLTLLVPPCSGIRTRIYVRSSNECLGCPLYAVWFVTAQMANTQHSLRTDLEAASTASVSADSTESLNSVQSQLQRRTLEVRTFEELVMSHHSLFSDINCAGQQRIQMIS